MVSHNQYNHCIVTLLPKDVSQCLVNRQAHNYLYNAIIVNDVKPRNREWQFEQYAQTNKEIMYHTVRAVSDNPNSSGNSWKKLGWPFPFHNSSHHSSTPAWCSCSSLTPQFLPIILLQQPATSLFLLTPFLFSHVADLCNELLYWINYIVCITYSWRHKMVKIASFKKKKFAYILEKKKKEKKTRLIIWYTGSYSVLHSKCLTHNGTLIVIAA